MRYIQLFESFNKITEKDMYDLLKNTMFWKYFRGDINDIYRNWTLKNRYYHNMKHLENLKRMLDNDKKLFTQEEYDMMILSIIYHDVIYVGNRDDNLNIDESIEYFKRDFPTLPNEYKNKIIEIIDSTRRHNFEEGDKLCVKLNYYDMSGILEGDVKTIIEDGNNVRKEHDKITDEFFKEKRIEFLRNYIKYNPNIEKAIMHINLIN